MARFTTTSLHYSDVAELKVLPQRNRVEKSASGAPAYTPLHTNGPGRVYCQWELHPSHTQSWKRRNAQWQVTFLTLVLNESCLNGWISPPHNFCTERSRFTQSPWSGLQSIMFLDWLQSEEPKHWKSSPVLLSDQYATLPLYPLISSWSQCRFCFGSLIALAHTFH